MDNMPGLRAEQGKEKKGIHALIRTVHLAQQIKENRKALCASGRAKIQRTYKE